MSKVQHPASQNHIRINHLDETEVCCSLCRPPQVPPRVRILRPYLNFVQIFIHPLLNLIHRSPHSHLIFITSFEFPGSNRRLFLSPIEQRGYRNFAQQTFPISHVSFRHHCVLVIRSPSVFKILKGMNIKKSTLWRTPFSPSKMVISNGTFRHIH